MLNPVSKWETGNYNPEYSPILAEAVNTFTSCTLLFRNSYNSAKLIVFTVERLNFFKKIPADSAPKEDTFPPLCLFVPISTLNMTVFSLSLKADREVDRRRK